MALVRAVCSSPASVENNCCNGFLLTGCLENHHFFETTRSVFIAAFGVLTAHHIRHIRSLLLGALGALVSGRGQRRPMYRKIGVGLANPVEEKPGWVSQAFGARLDPD